MSRIAGVVFVVVLAGIFLAGGRVVCGSEGLFVTIVMIGTWLLAVVAGAIAVGWYFVEWSNRVLLAVPAFIGGGMIAACVALYVWLLAIANVCGPID
jgi:hypothetical protein